MWSSVASSRVWKQWNCSLLGEPLCQCWHHYHGLINEYLQHFDVVLILLILSACRQDRSIWDFVLLQDADPHTIREAWMSELVDYMCYFEIWWFWSKMSHRRNVESVSSCSGRHTSDWCETITRIHGSAAVKVTRSSLVRKVGKQLAKPTNQHRVMWVLGEN